MSKTILGVVAVLVIAGGVYYFLNSQKSGDAMQQPSAQGDVAAQPTGKKMAFSEFIKQGGAYKCTVTQDVGGVQTQGTTYINGGMIRGEFNTKVQGMEITSNMILRDGYTYSWSSMAPTMGFKVKVAATAGDVNAPAQGQYSFNAQQIGDYNCEVWTSDASKFAVPTSVTFREMGK